MSIGLGNCSIRTGLVVDHVFVATPLPKASLVIHVRYKKKLLSNFKQDHERRKNYQKSLFIWNE